MRRERREELLEKREGMSKWFPGFMPKGAGGQPAERAMHRRQSPRLMKKQKEIEEALRKKLEDEELEKAWNDPKRPSGWKEMLAPPVLRSASNAQLGFVEDE